MKAHVFLLALICALPVRAQQGPELEAKIKEGDAATLFRLWQDHGNGLSDDHRERPLIKSAQAGHRQAQANLGQRCLGRREYKRAQRYLREAAEKGDTEAQGWMGMMYSPDVSWDSDTRPPQLPKPDAYVAYVWFALAKMGGYSGLDHYLEQLADGHLPPKLVREAEAEAASFHTALKKNLSSGFLDHLTNQSKLTAFGRDSLQHVAAGEHGREWQPVAKLMLKNL